MVAFNLDGFGYSSPPYTSCSEALAVLSTLSSDRMYRRSFDSTFEFPMASLISGSSSMLGSLMASTKDILDILTSRILSSAVSSPPSFSITSSTCVNSTLRGSRCSDWVTGRADGAFLARVLVLEILRWFLLSRTLVSSPFPLMFVAGDVKYSMMLARPLCVIEIHPFLSLEGIFFHKDIGNRNSRVSFPVEGSVWLVRNMLSMGWSGMTSS